MLVIPKVGGITIFSPKLDRLRNSIRGVEFCDQLTDIYRFHKYDSVHTGEKISKIFCLLFSSQLIYVNRV